ncbi:MAG: hypothetical protein JNL79_18275 [Myxococcales bacterium]|nr:hypothetical protein [Myxococcales bacterium]
MRKLGVWAWVVATALVVVGSSCGKDDEAQTPTGTTERYRGSLVGASELAGTLTLDLAPGLGTASVTPKATATKISGTVTVNVPGVGPISLEGTVAVAGGVAKFSGSGAGGSISFEGTLVDGVLSGTFTSPWGSGSFSVTRDDVAGLKLYCGAFTGGARGRVHVFTLGEKGGGVFAGGPTGVFLGTFKASKLDFALATGSGSAVLSGSTFTGTFSADAPVPSATFTASEAACSTLVPRPDGDAGTDGATDATSDGSTDGATDGATDGGATDPLLLHESTLGSDQFSFPTRYNASLFVARTGAAGGGVLEVAIDGSKVSTFVTTTTGDGFVTGLATDTKNLYWQLTGAAGSTNGRVDYKSVLGAPTASTAVSALDYPNVLVTDGTDLYSTGTSGKVIRFGPGGELKNATFGTGLNDLAADGTYVWLAPAPGGSVSRWSKDLTGVTEILSSTELAATPIVRSLHVAGADLFAVAYAADFSKYAILRKAKDGTGTVTTMATFPGGGDAPFGVVADATHVYFGGSCGAGPAKGCVRRLPRTASLGTPESMASGLESYIRDVTVDANYVFYTDVKRVWRKKK